MKKKEPAGENVKKVTVDSEMARIDGALAPGMSVLALSVLLPIFFFNLGSIILLN